MTTPRLHERMGLFPDADLWQAVTMPRTWKIAVVETEDKFTWALTADDQTVFESDDRFDDEAGVQAEVDSIKKADVIKKKH